jgi:hypothetical protein
MHPYRISLQFVWRVSYSLLCRSSITVYTEVTLFTKSKGYHRGCDRSAGDAQSSRAPDPMINVSEDLKLSCCHVVFCVESYTNHRVVVFTVWEYLKKETFSKILIL